MPILIYHLRLDDVKYLFWVYIPTIMAFPLITIDQINAFLKINDGVDRISVVNLVTARIENQKFVKHLKNVR